MSDREDSSEEAAVGRLIEEWAAAVRRKDMKGVLRHHAPDMLMFDVPPPFQIKGLDAYEKSWALFYSASPNPPTFDIVELNVTAGSDVAFATAAMRCVWVHDDKSNDLDFRLTLGLHKIDGQWMILHEHHSVPATS
jgi:uncharacterized protein (TIGR02246 family)